MQAYEAGRYEEAYTVFSELLRAYPDSEDVNFALGLSSWAMGKLSHASFAFERVLMLNPDNQRARLELARTYYAMRQYELAEDEFRKAYASDLPETVRENVKRYLEQLEQRTRRWRFDAEVGAGAIWDDNVNFGPSDGTVDTLLGELRVVSNALPNETWGTLAIGSAFLSYDVGDRGKWLGTAALAGYRNWFDDASGQEIEYARAGLGLRYVGRRLLFDIPLRADALDYGGDPLLRMIGVDPSLLYAADAHWHFITRLNLEERDYRDNDARDASFGKAGQVVRYLWGRRPHTLSMEWNAFIEEADEDGFTNEGWEGVLGIEFTLPWALKLYGKGYYRRIEYEEVLYTELQDAAREDDRLQLVGGLRKEIAPSVELDANFRHINNDSNFGLYDYERNVATVTTVVKF
jgi:tetratricopeptide (TPR) repeat protein